VWRRFWLDALQHFAKGLRDDDPVKAGVTLPWSNGPVEGDINRLKTRKRQMFGRASLDLLPRRFLLAASRWDQRVCSASGPPPQRRVGVHAEPLRPGCLWKVMRPCDGAAPSAL
jgi:hypothetical protein